MAVLIFARAKDRDDYYTLGDEPAIVGRDASCEIAVGDASVSRRHARIARASGGWRVEDLDSKNGVFVDDERVSQASLRDGCRVRFGRVEAVFRENYAGEVAMEGDARSTTCFVEREELLGRGQRLAAIYELADAAGRAESESAMAQTALEIVLRELGCDHAYLGLCGEDSPVLARGFHRRASGQTERFALSRTLLNRVLAAGKHLLIADVGLDVELQDLASVEATRAKSVLCAPMQAAGRLIGVLYADTRSVVRPFSTDDLAFVGALGSLLASILGNLRTIAALRQANQVLQQRIEGLRLIGKSPLMAAAREQIRKFAAKGKATVLILGPSGSGKELAARLVHQMSDRAERPFRDVNCAAFPKDLIESELFGHVRGAFTSATGDRRGLFQLADRGCLFLDEIGEMPLDLQGKLLRVLETGEFRPVGAEKTVKVDVRIIAATNKDLAAAVRRGAFRDDLYYRLNVLQIALPGLAERREDIPDLCAHFLADLRARLNTQVVGLAPEALDLLKRHDWPGNVRELRNVIERALYVCEDELIGPEDLMGLEADEPGDESADETPRRDGRLDGEIAQLERARLREALERHKWNRSRAAAELGIARKTLLAKMRKYEL